MHGPFSQGNIYKTFTLLRRSAFWQFLFRWIYYCHSKGQLISKCIFGIFKSPKKHMIKFDFTTMVPQVELFLFIFWENWRHQKDISKLTSTGMKLAKRTSVYCRGSIGEYLMKIPSEMFWPSCLLPVSRLVYTIHLMTITSDSSHEINNFPPKEWLS